MASRSSRRRAWRHNTRRVQRFGLSERLTARERGPVAGTTDQVRPQDGERSRKAERARVKPRPLWNRWFPSWLAILLFPYDDLHRNKAFSDQCYELTISAGTRRLRICAIWP